MTSADPLPPALARPAPHGDAPQRQPAAAALADSPRPKAMAVALTLALAAPVCAVLTYILIANANSAPDRGLLRVMLIIDFCLALTLIGMIAWRIGAMVLANASAPPGRGCICGMVRLFTAIAVAPALVMGVFSALMVTAGLQIWLGDHVSSMVRNAVAVTESVADARKQRASLGAARVAGRLDATGPRTLANSDMLRQAVHEIAAHEALTLVFVIDGAGAILARGRESYLYRYNPPSAPRLSAVRDQGALHYHDRRAGEAVGLAPISALEDAYVLVALPLGAESGGRIAETEELALQYRTIEAGRFDVMLFFAVSYLVFAVMVVGAAVWFGIWFADRLSRPIGRLAGAADQIANGDLDVRVPEQKGEDEIAVLSRVFNRMADQVQRQHSALDQRRQLTEAVLSGVSAGVVSLSQEGVIRLANDSAEVLTGVAPGGLTGRTLAEVAPALTAIVDRAAVASNGAAEGRATLSRGGREIELLVRASRLGGGDDGYSYVVTFDDMTALVSAQRMAAWGDVARRVAHEIKNPLTPIQLSADRLKRRLAQEAGAKREAVERCADTILRQVGGIRRMVDEFSEFARMPEPTPAPVDLTALIREAVETRQGAHPGVAFVCGAADANPDADANADVGADVGAPLWTTVDAGLMAQALANLIKNAAESVAARLEADQNEADQNTGQNANPAPGVVRIHARRDEAGFVIDVEDNGVGLGGMDPARLTEPYVTTRNQGVGLGLAIVKRIIEQHGGTLTLAPAAPFADGAPPGARARVTLPPRAAVAPPSASFQTRRPETSPTE